MLTAQHIADAACRGGLFRILPITTQKYTIREQRDMMNRPFFKNSNNFIVRCLQRFELAAVRPPVRIRLELHTDTIHVQGSFPCIQFQPERAAHTNITLRFSWPHNFRIRLKQIATVTIIDDAITHLTPVVAVFEDVTKPTIKTNTLLFHDFTPPKNLFLIARYKERSCSSA